MASTQWRSCIDRAAAARGQPGALDNEIVQSVIAECDRHARAMETLAIDEFGDEAGQSLARASRVDLEHRVRALLRGAQPPDDQRPMARLRDCIWAEATKAAITELEGDGLIQEVRSRCSQVEKQAVDATVEQSGRNDIPEMLAKSEPSLAGLILRIVADVRAGRQPTASN